MRILARETANIDSNRVLKGRRHFYLNIRSNLVLRLVLVRCSVARLRHISLMPLSRATIEEKGEGTNFRGKKTSRGI